MKHRRHPNPLGSKGFSQVEALVASAVLMVAVSQSLNLYGSTLQATGKAQLRDGVNAAINADLEQIRHTISTWALTESSDGQLAYSPSNEACESGALASSLLADHAASLPTSSSLNLSNTPSRVKAIRIERTIATAADNPNLIVVRYATSGDSPITLRQQSTLSLPAQGWCV